MKTKAQHRELEIKLDATGIMVNDFKEWAFGLMPSQYLHVIGPDVYYTQGKNVLRHRQNGDGAGELTVKRRKSEKSTKDRLEIDLRFDGGTTVDDVTRFLLATGWEQKFTVVKDCHIFWFDTQPGVEAVLYDVRCILPTGRETEPRRFAEFEIHKADSNHPKALTILKDWEADVREVFPDIGEVMAESLYEIYSGKRYGLIKS